MLKFKCSVCCLDDGNSGDDNDSNESQKEEATADTHTAHTHTYTKYSSFENKSEIMDFAFKTCIFSRYRVRTGARSSHICARRWYKPSERVIPNLNQYTKSPILFIPACILQWCCYSHQPFWASEAANRMARKYKHIYLRFNWHLI